MFFRNSASFGVAFNWVWVGNIGQFYGGLLDCMGWHDWDGLFCMRILDTKQWECMRESGVQHGNGSAASIPNLAHIYIGYTERGIMGAWHGSWKFHLTSHAWLITCCTYFKGGG